MTYNPSRSERKRLRGVIELIEELDQPQCVNGWWKICKRGPVYLHKGDGIIIKRPNFILNSKTPLKVRVPTIKLTAEWVTQPEVFKYDTDLAVKIIKQQLGKVFCDLHKYNVGWYRGEPVMFDW
jgi:hypothetical protein